MTCNNWSTTAQMFSSLFEKPKMTEKLLSKPPFKYIFDIFFETSRQTGFAAGLFTAEEQDANNYDVKEKKISFLQKVIDLTSLMLKENIEAKPSKIVAGLEPDDTNTFLQAMYRAAVSLVDSTPFVNQVLQAHNSGGQVAAQDNVQKAKPKQEPAQEQSKPVEKQPQKQPASQQQEQQPIKNDGKKQQDLEKKKKEDEAAAAAQAQKEKDEAKKKQQQQQAEEQKRQEEKRQQEEKKKQDEAKKQKELQEQKQKADQKAQQQLKEQQLKEQQAQKEKEAALKTEVKVIRPPTAKARPGKQTNSQNDERAKPGVTSGVIRDGDQQDDDEMENQQDFVSSTQNVQAKQQLDMSKQGKYIQNALKDDLDDGGQQQGGQIEDQAPQQNEEGGGIKMNRLGKKKKKPSEKSSELERQGTSEPRAAGGQFSSSTAGTGTTENIDVLIKLVQQICQNANPLGKSLEFINDDVESMNNELQYWQKQYKQSKEKMANDLRVTEETLQPMQDKLAEIKLQIQDQKAKISNVKSQIIQNQQTIKQLLMSVVTNRQ